MMYPSDWRYYEKSGPESFSPHRLFQVSFLSPSSKAISDMVYVWFNIESIGNSSLKDRKNILIKNLNNSALELAVQPTTLSGIGGYMIDYKYQAIELQRHLGIEAIKDGFLYSFDFTARPETFEENIYFIESMIKSTKISPIVK